MPEYDFSALIKQVERREEAEKNTECGRSKTSLISLPMEALVDYPADKHRFRPATGQRMEQLVESIRTNGILNPLLVRRLPGDRYQILAGHNRRTAAKQLGYREVPCIVREFPDDDCAHLAVLADNLDGRLEILPSERAWSYRDQLEIRKRQGRRTDLTSCQVGTKLRTDAQIATDVNESARQVQRYIRLTYLIPELLQRVDEGRIGIGTAVELSYLGKHSQEVVYSFCYRQDPMRPLKEAQARELRKIEEDPDQIVDEDVLEALTAKKPQQRLRTVKLDMSNLRQYFPKTTSEEIVIQTIYTALAKYFHREEDA